MYISYTKTWHILINSHRTYCTLNLKQNYAETLLQKIKSPRKLFSLILKPNHMLYKHDTENLALIPIVGKSGFTSHTKHTAETTQIYFIHER